VWMRAGANPAKPWEHFGAVLLAKV
jgi:hypothetical protein